MWCDGKVAVLIVVIGNCHSKLVSLTGEGAVTSVIDDVVSE